MKTMSLRGLARKAPDIKEDTLITFQGQVIGTYRPNWGAVEMNELLVPERFTEIKAEMEAPMEEPIKKELDKTDLKVDERGRISKGLGDIPGRSSKTEDPYRRFTPAPKPGTKK